MKMANWNDPNVCVLIHPTAFDSHPGWCSTVQRLTEEGKLKRHYLRFGPKQGRDVQRFISEAPAHTEWKVVTHRRGKFTLVKVTFLDQPRPDPTPTLGAA